MPNKPPQIDGPKAFLWQAAFQDLQSLASIQSFQE
jgi:hypothetical protein